MKLVNVHKSILVSTLVKEFSDKISDVLTFKKLCPVTFTSLPKIAEQSLFRGDETLQSVLVGYSLLDFSAEPRG